MLSITEIGTNYPVGLIFFNEAFTSINRKTFYEARLLENLVNLNMYGVLEEKNWLSLMKIVALLEFITIMIY